MALDAVIFDVDGTLAETELDGHRVAFNRAFREAGLPWNWSVADYARLLAVTGGKERMRHYAASFDPARSTRPDFAELVPRVHRRKTEIYTQLVAQGRIGLRPGVKRLLGQLRAEGVRLAVATTTTPDNLEALLAASLGAEAMGWFDAVGAGDVVPAKKPAPDIYFWVLERLGLPARACIAIEDSAPGLRAARAADLPVVITPSVFTRGQNFDAAVAVVSDLGEPERPMRVIRGDAGGRACVDAELLRLWHRQSAGG